MQNILTTKLPESINVFGTDIEIYTDFKKWIDFEIKLEKENESFNNILKLLDFVKNKKLINHSNLEEVINQLIVFYNCGEKVIHSDKKQDMKIMYSFNKDQFMIYSDFIRFYGTDLSECTMHWWKFKKLFIELPLQSATKEAMKYRSIRIDSKMSHEQRKFYVKMKQIYSLEKEVSKEKRQAQISSILFKGMNIKRD